MKRILYLIGVSLVMLVWTSSCNKDVELYSGCKSGIFIQEIYSTDIYGNPLSYRDSISYSFANARENVTSGIVRVFIRSIGEVVNYDRPYVLKAAEGTTAIEGEDYDLSENDLMIKANQSIDTLYVKLLRTPKLRNQTVRLKLELVPNEHFDTPFTEYKNSSSWSADGNMHSAISYIINFNEKYSKPYYWDWYGDEYFGQFSVNKYLAINEYMGWTGTDWSNAGMTGQKIQYGRLEYFANYIRKYLQQKADEGEPLLDDDGSYMQLGANYLVDYSHLSSN